MLKDMEYKKADEQKTSENLEDQIKFNKDKRTLVERLNENTFEQKKPSKKNYTPKDYETKTKTARQKISVVISQIQGKQVEYDSENNPYILEKKTESYSSPTKISRDDLLAKLLRYLGIDLKKKVFVEKTRVVDLKKPLQEISEMELNKILADHAEKISTQNEKISHYISDLDETLYHTKKELDSLLKDQEEYFKRRINIYEEYKKLRELKKEIDEILPKMSVNDENYSKYTIEDITITEQIKNLHSEFLLLQQKIENNENHILMTRKNYASYMNKKRNLESKQYSISETLKVLEHFENNLKGNFSDEEYISLVVDKGNETGLIAKLMNTIYDANAVSTELGLLNNNNQLIPEQNKEDYNSQQKYELEHIDRVFKESFMNSK